MADDEDPSEENPGCGTGGTWNSHERDALKRLVLQYGVGRYQLIRRQDRVLERATDIEMQSYTVSFFKELLNCLNQNEHKKIDPKELEDLKTFMQN